MLTPLFQVFWIFLLHSSAAPSVGGASCLARSLTKSDKIIYLVHATENIPKNGVMKAGAIDVSTGKAAESHFRTTLHFSVGDLVKGHDFGDWEDMPVAVLVPYDPVAHQIVNLNLQDTYILGDLSLPEGTIILTSDPKAATNLGPNVKLVKRNPKLSLRADIRQVIRKNNGLVVEPISNSAVTSGMSRADGKLVAESELFERYSLLRPGMSRGTHHYALEGDASILGSIEIISNAFYSHSKHPTYGAWELRFQSAIGRKLLERAKKTYGANPDFQKQASELEKVFDRYDKALEGNGGVEIRRPFDLAVALKNLEIEQIDELVRGFEIGKHSSHQRLIAATYAIKYIERNNAPTEVLLGRLNGMLKGSGAEQRESLVLEVMEGFSYSFVPGSEFLPGIFDFLSIPSLRSALTRGASAPQGNPRTITEFFNSYVPQQITWEDVRKVSADKLPEGKEIISSIIGNAPFTVSEPIESWRQFWRFLQEANYQHDRISLGLEEIFSPLSKADTGRLDNYTLESFYRDLYFRKFGPIEQFAKRLGLSRQFLKDFPRWDILFREERSLFEIVRAYRFSPL